jgi:pimeloyl-ACP methyl ester carboxylesterase
VRARARELDELSTKGAADDALALKGMRLVWPAYFADPEAAPPMPELRMASERSAQMVQSINAELPKLEAELPEIRIPVGFVHGSRSPMPVEASTDAAERIPGAWVDIVEGAGHFIWVEGPGAVRAALRRLTAADEATTARFNGADAVRPRTGRGATRGARSSPARRCAAPKRRPASRRPARRGLRPR